MTTLRWTRPDDLPALAELAAERFGGAALSPAEWRWKYEQLPGRSRSAVALAADGSLVAHAGALCLPARWRGGEVGAWQLVDFVGTTRGGGLRSALVDLGRWLLDELPAAGDLPWIFGFPSQRHFRLGQRVFGYRPLTALTPLAGELTAAVGAVDAARCELASGDSCDVAAEAVWRACDVSGVRRSAAFLNWRYHARPQRYYRFYRCTCDGMAGMAVFAFASEVAAATELWLPPGPDWRPALRAMATDLAASGLRRWTFWPPPRAMRGVLAGLGLAPGEDVFVGYRGRQGAALDIDAMGEFFYQMGDYDIT